MFDINLGFHSSVLFAANYVLARMYCMFWRWEVMLQYNPCDSIVEQSDSLVRSSTLTRVSACMLSSTHPRDLLVSIDHRFKVT